MQFRIVSSLVASLVLGALSPCAGQDPKGFYVNEELGFRVKVPEEWSEIPVRIDENWIVSKFLSKKTWLSKSKEWNEEHRPLMTVIVFTEDATRFKGWAQQQRGNTTFTRITDLPYRDYQDYLKRNLANGYFFQVEETGESAGTKLDRFEILQHKRDPAKRLLAWVFHGEDMDVAIEFEVLEDRIDRLRAVCEQSLASFRFDEGGKLRSKGPSTGPADAALADSKLWTEFRDEWKKAPRKERHRLRKDVEERRFEKLRETTPESWTITESKHFLVISHADPKTTKRMTDSIETFREWCNETLGELTDEYVRRGVLRICADDAEYMAYFKGSGDSWTFSSGEDREIVTYKDGYAGSSGLGAGELFDDILEMYLADLDPLLLMYTPSWLRAGMVDFVTSANIKGNELDFRVDDYEREELKELERQGKLKTLRELMTLDEEAYWKEVSTGRRTRSQLTNAFRFLIGPARSQPQLKHFLFNYLTAVIVVADEHRKKWEAEPVEVDKEPETEEQEEARVKKQSKDDSWRKKRRAIHEAVSLKALTFDAKTWERLENAYGKFAKN